MREFNITDEEVMKQIMIQIKTAQNSVEQAQMLSNLQDEIILDRWMQTTKYLMCCQLIKDDVFNKINSFEEGLTEIKELISSEPIVLDRDEINYEHSLWLVELICVRRRLCAMPDAAQVIIDNLKNEYETMQMIEIVCSDPENIKTYTDKDVNTLYDLIYEYTSHELPQFRTRSLAALVSLDTRRGGQRAIDLLCDEDPQVNFYAAVLLNVTMGYEAFNKEHKGKPRGNDDRNGGEGWLDINFK